jgi:hypothetical protein
VLSAKRLKRAVAGGHAEIFKRFSAGEHVRMSPRFAHYASNVCLIQKPTGVRRCAVPRRMRPSVRQWSRHQSYRPELNRLERPGVVPWAAVKLDPHRTACRSNFRVSRPRRSSSRHHLSGCRHSSGCQSCRATADGRPRLASAAMAFAESLRIGEGLPRQTTPWRPNL